MNYSFAHKSPCESSPTSRLRIADILLLDERQEERLYLMANCRRRRTGDERPAGSGCTRFVGRLLPSLRRPKEKRTAPGEECGGVNLPSPDVRDSPSSLPETSAPSEQCSRSNEASLNVGVGYSLLYLLASCKNELDQMVELRKQMANLLHNSQAGLQQKEDIPRTPETNDIHAYSTADVIKDRESNSFFSPQVLETPSSVSCDKPLEVDFPRSKDCAAGMDQLELELQAELERLQLHLDTDELQRNPLLEMAEVTSSDSTTSSLSDGLSSGVVIDPEEDTCEVHNGVCPLELERRLHELLETRLKEQIRELEAALERAKHKLHEQELEMYWWKDTVCLISRHVAEPSRLTFGHNPDQEN